MVFVLTLIDFCILYLFILVSLFFRINEYSFSRAVFSCFDVRSLPFLFDWMIESDLNDSKRLIFDQLHSAQHEINNLRLLNVCLQSTLLRVQSQLIDSISDEQIKRNQTKEKLACLRQTDDQSRRIIHQQQISFFHHLRNLVESKTDKSIKPISLVKYEKQIEILFEMFHEFNTLIHTEHNDRISQLYITLAQTSQSVIKTRESKIFVLVVLGCSSSSSRTDYSRSSIDRKTEISSTNLFHSSCIDISFHHHLSHLHISSNTLNKRLIGFSN